MVQYQTQHVVVVGEPQQGCPQRQALSQIERRSELLAHDVTSDGFAFPVGMGTKVPLVKADPRLGVDDLLRAPILSGKACPQAVVAGENLGERELQSFRDEPTAEPL